MTKLLVVVGATGLQGSSCIHWFQQHEPSWKLRGLTRNPSSEAATSLAEQGVEIVKADLNNVDSLKPAFADATAIYAYTDFGGIMRGPEVMGRFMAGQLAPPVGAAAFEIEVRHGKNIADAAATVPGLHRLIWSALSDIKKWSKGKYVHGYHFDAKAKVTEYMMTKPELKGKVSTVQMGSFASNLIREGAQFGARKQADGSIAWHMPLPGDLVLPWMDIESDTGAFVKALIDAPSGTHVEGSSEDLSAQQYTDLFNAHSGLKMEFEQIPTENFMTDDPSGWKREMIESLSYIREFGFCGGDPEILTPDQLEEKGYALSRTKIANHISRVDWSPLLQLRT